MTVQARTADVGDEMGNAQIRLHRSAAGEAFRVSLEALSRAAQSANRQTESLCQVWVDQGRRGNYEGELAAQRLIGREICETIAGTAFALAQKHIALVTSAIADISRECVKVGKGELALAAEGGTGLMKRSERIEQIHGAANFWKHGHEKPRGPTRKVLENLKIAPDDPSAFEKLLEFFGFDAPDYDFRRFWSWISEWAGEIVRDVQRELETKGVLFLQQHSDTGSRTWAWTLGGREILTYEMADLFR